MAWDVVVVSSVVNVVCSSAINVNVGVSHRLGASPLDPSRGLSH